MTEDITYPSKNHNDGNKVTEL